MGYIIAIVTHGYFVVPMYTIIFKRIFGATFEPPLPLIVVTDLAVHVVPVILFGIPSHFRSYVFACLFVATWYTIVRKELEEIYIIPHSPVYKRDIIVYGGLLLSICIAYALAKKG